MESYQEAFARRFLEAHKASKFDSLRRLSIDSDCAPSRASKIASGDFDGSKDGPGIFGMWRMAASMETTLDELLPPARASHDRPGVTSFFARYRRQGASIQHFEDILEYCDLYLKPSRGKTNLVRVGAKSLLAERTMITDPSILQLEFESWPKDRRTAISEWQSRAWQAGALAEPEYFEGSYASTRRNVQIPVLRAACRLDLGNTKEGLILYCDPLWQER